MPKEAEQAIKAEQAEKPDQLTPSPQRLALGVAYQGAAFCGWQRQRSQPSVQATLEQALSQVAAAPVQVQAAGRTDAGVHATGQVVHFDTGAQRPLKAWVRGVNSLLPAAVAVLWAQPVAAEFHARFDATERRYQFIYCDAQVNAPGVAEGAWMVGQPLAADLMHQAGQQLVGEHNFSSFRGAGCQAPTPYRRVHRLTVTRFGDLVVLDIVANAYLLHMVRNIAGGLSQVGLSKAGLGQRPVAWLAEVLAAQDRRVLGPTAPPQGLFLVAVRYPGLQQPAPLSPPLLRALGPAL